MRAAIIETGYENALRSERMTKRRPSGKSPGTSQCCGRLRRTRRRRITRVYRPLGAGFRSGRLQTRRAGDSDDGALREGLEFPLVFIVGLEDGLFPHSRSATDRAELEEERRLAYVAMTRAERYLYVTHAMKRRVYGEELASEPSPFLNEMPSELLEDLSRASRGCRSRMDRRRSITNTASIARNGRSTKARLMTALIP